MKTTLLCLLASALAAFSAAPVAPFVGQYEVARRDHFLVVSNIALGNSPTGGVSAAAASVIASNAAIGITTTTTNGMWPSINAKANTNGAVVQGYQMNGETRIGPSDFKLVDDGLGNAGIGRNAGAMFISIIDLDSTVWIGNGSGTTNLGPLLVTDTVTAPAFVGDGSALTGITVANTKAETNAPDLFSPRFFGDIVHRAITGNSLTYTYVADENSGIDSHVISAARNEWVDAATAQGILGYHRYGSGDIGISLRPQGAGSTTNVGDFRITGNLYAGTLYTPDIVTSNSINVSVGGTGGSNFTAGSVMIANGTNPMYAMPLGSGLSTNGGTLSATGGGASYDIDVTFSIYGNTATPIWTNTLGTNTTLVIWDAVGVIAGSTNIARTKISEATFHRYASTAVFDGSNTLGSTTAVVLKTNGVNSVIAYAAGAAGETNTVRLRGFYMVVTNGIATASGGGGVPANIVGWWKLNDASGGTASDSSGNGNDGTLTAGTWGSGLLSFDGSGDYVTIANESNFDFERTDAFSITAWIKLNSSATGSRIIVSKEQTTGNAPGIDFRADTDNLLLRIYLVQADGSAIQSATSVSSVSLNTLMFVAVTYDGSSSGAGLKLYINNSSATAGTGTLSQSILNNDPVIIGKGPGGSDWYGDINEARIYNVELSSGQVGTLYSGGAQ